MPVTKLCKFCGNPFQVKPSKADAKPYCDARCYNAARHGFTPVTCAHCGIVFNCPNKTLHFRRFCSQNCFHQWNQNENHAGYRGGPVERTCEECGAAFKTKTILVERGGGRFCGLSCSAKWNQRTQGFERRSQRMTRVVRNHLENMSPDERARRAAMNADRLQSDDHRRRVSYAARLRWSKLSPEERSEMHRGSRNPAWRGGNINVTRGIGWNRIREKVKERDDYCCQRCGAVSVRLEVHHIVPYRVSHDNSLSNLVTLCKPCHGFAEAEYWRLEKDAGGLAAA